MNQERSILHLNAADFAVAVERVSDRSLNEKPVIVAPLQAARATVYDMSDEAYKDGVRKGMLLRQAARRCKSARIVPPRFDLYRRAMSSFVNEARSYSPILEYGTGDGHLFLDITGTHRLFGTAPDVGWRLSKQIHSSMGIKPIWSLAANKLVSKVASRLVKPVGEYIVAPGEEKAFFAPLSLSLLPGVASSEMQCLYEFNIRKIGQLASLDKTQLYAVFGRRGDTLYDISRGVDSDVVRPEQKQPPVIRREHVFGDDTGDHKIVEGAVTALAVRIGMELRSGNMVGRRLVLQLNYTDGSQVIRQAINRQSNSDDFSLRGMALLALERAWRRRTRIRSCRLTCDRLHRQSPQMMLFPTPDKTNKKKAQLLGAMDAVRHKFGVDAMRLGSQISLAS
jgi:DNA polymerase-4